MTNLGDDVLETRLRETLRAVAASHVRPRADAEPSLAHLELTSVVTW